MISYTGVVLDLFYILLLVGLVVIAVPLAILGVSDSRKNKEALASLELRYPGAKTYRSVTGTYVAIDTEKEKIVVGSPSISTNVGGPYEAVYNFDQIVTVEKHVNGGVVSSTNRGSQAVGAAVGALALGGVGAIIGGLSASSKSVNTINKISVKFVVDDRSRPFHEILFYNSSKGTKANGFLVGIIEQNAEEFHGHLLAAMHKASKPVAAEKEDTGLSNSLKQIWELKESGAITEGEFEKLKKGLLDKM